MSKRTGNAITLTDLLEEVQMCIRDSFSAGGLHLTLDSSTCCLKNSIIILPQTCGVVTVSYTHLDVYKRQDLCIGCTQCTGICPEVFQMTGILAVAVPVSYTHLDVYKRQMLYSSSKPFS